MARPRIKDPHLPPSVYFKHGAYYKVVKGVWHRLGSTLPQAEQRLTKLPKQLDDHRTEILVFAYRVLARARQNAKGRRGGIAFELTRDDVHHMLNAAGWRCAITGAPFSVEVVRGSRPFAPSIDRRDSAIGYLPSNCRMVCVAANYAMNTWGEDVLWRLFEPKRHHLVLDGVGQTDKSSA